jgi:hypothetical protein
MRRKAPTCPREAVTILDGVGVMRFEFDWDPAYRRILRVIGVRPGTSWVEVGDELVVRYGPWHARTPIANITRVCVTGPYVPLRGVGPHLSLKDRGITFGTNARRGICALFRDPITGIDRVGVIKHPGLTLTLADIEGFAAAVGHPLD